VYGGTSITITATGLGPLATISVTIAGAVCTSLAKPTATTLTCITPALQGVAGVGAAVVVSVSGRTDSKPFLSYDSPYITPHSLQITGVSQFGNILLPSPHANTELSFSGIHFMPADGSQLRVSYGPAGSAFWFDCPIVASTDTTIRCTTTAGVGANLHLLVAQKRTQGTVVLDVLSPESADTVSYAPPAIQPNTIRKSVTSAKGAASFTGM
jgi:hypothetical protein